MSNETPTAPAARLQPSASYSFTMRLHAPQEGGAFARVAQAIADADAMLGAIDLVSVESRGSSATSRSPAWTPVRPRRSCAQCEGSRAYVLTASLTVLPHAQGRQDRGQRRAAAEDPRRPFDSSTPPASRAAKRRTRHPPTGKRRSVLSIQATVPRQVPTS
jgi:hypothetical protein